MDLYLEQINNKENKICTKSKLTTVNKRGDTLSTDTTGYNITTELVML
jgi:hypothetical protein